MKSNVKNKLHGPVHQPRKPCRRTSWHPREQWAASQDQVPNPERDPKGTKSPCEAAGKAESPSLLRARRRRSRHRPEPLQRSQNRPGQLRAPRPVTASSSAAKPKEKRSTEPQKGQDGRHHSAAPGPSSLFQQSHPGAHGTGWHPDGSGISSPREPPQPPCAIRCSPPCPIHPLRDEGHGHPRLSPPRSRSRG